ncbi:MAG: hypothetical protein GX847_11940, partial [Clostridiales bacterium]|nr:hypothetical protein [Clostridiales bacterium]
MVISTFEKENRLYYQIKDYRVELEKTFASHGYLKTGDTYVKSFPLTFPHRENIIKNYRRDAEKMFDE